MEPVLKKFPFFGKEVAQRAIILEALKDAIQSKYGTLVSTSSTDSTRR